MILAVYAVCPVCVQVEGEMQWEGQRIPNWRHPAAPVGVEGEATEVTVVSGRRVGLRLTYIDTHTHTRTYTLCVCDRVHKNTVVLAIEQIQTHTQAHAHTHTQAHTPCRLKHIRPVDARRALCVGLLDCMHAMQVGAPRQFDFPVKDHVTIAEALDLVDFDSAAEVRK